MLNTHILEKMGIDIVSVTFGTPLPGTNIDYLSKVAISFAVTNNCQVSFVHNDKKYYCLPDGEVKENFDLFTTKEKAIQLANTIGNEVLKDRALGKNIISSNDVGQLVINYKDKYL